MKGKKVLIIDDDMSMIKVMEKVLKNDGYQVQWANDAISGLQIIYEDAPDCILLDVLMPGMDGQELARKIAADPKINNIPVIFTTVTVPLEMDKGNEMITVDGKAYRAFAKPLHTRKVLSVIRKEINIREHGNWSS